MQISAEHELEILIRVINRCKVYNESKMLLYVFRLAKARFYKNWREEGKKRWFKAPDAESFQNSFSLR